MIRIFAILLTVISTYALAADGEKAKMVFLGAFDAGQPGVSIFKMFDATDDVLCYVLMPEVAGRKSVESGKWVYDGNGVGSISCLKVRVPVVPIGQQTK